MGTTIALFIYNNREKSAPSRSQSLPTATWKYIESIVEILGLFSTSRVHDHVHDGLILGLSRMRATYSCDCLTNGIRDVLLCVEDIHWYYEPVWPSPATLPEEGPRH